MLKYSGSTLRATRRVSQSTGTQCFGVLHTRNSIYIIHTLSFTNGISQHKNSLHRHFAIYSTTIYKQKLVAHGQIDKYIGTYATQLVFAIYHILVQTKIMERDKKAQGAYTDISKHLLTPLSPLQVAV
jgi:hypothetical protein